MKEPNEAGRKILAEVAALYERMIKCQEANQTHIREAIRCYAIGDMLGAHEANQRASDSSEVNYLVNLSVGTIAGLRFADPELYAEYEERMRIDREKRQLGTMTVEHLRKELEDHPKNCHDATCVTPRAIAELVREKTTVPS